jgi:hypothetical protein
MADDNFDLDYNQALPIGELTGTIACDHGVEGTSNNAAW